MKTTLLVASFLGQLPRGLIVHPDEKHIIYSLGCNVIIQNINSPHVEPLWGHDNAVSCIAVSHSGKYLASGQVTHSGFKVHLTFLKSRLGDQQLKLRENWGKFLKTVELIFEIFLIFSCYMIVLWQRCLTFPKVHCRVMIYYTNWNSIDQYE